MHAAEVQIWGNPPKYIETTAPSPPGTDSVQIHLLATAVHNLVRVRASGKHYSAPTLPHVPGYDAVGYIPTESNRRVYFNAMAAGGSFREIVNVPRKDVFDLPEGLDSAHAAALVNPAQSSWLAVKKRTSGLPKSFNALVLGATSLSGKVAVPLLRKMGASKVFGVARNEAAMGALGLDGTVVLRDPPEETDFPKVLGEVDVVLDYIYGDALGALLKALKPGRRVQVLQIGSLGGGAITLDEGILRGRDVVLSGSGLGTIGPHDIEEELPELLKALKDVPKQTVKECKLSEIESAWEDKKARLVFLP